MTRMFRNLKVHEANLTKLLSEKECEATVDDFNYGAATPIIDMASRLVRFGHGDMEKFRKLLSHHIEAGVLNKCFEGPLPLMVLDKEPGQVRVFTNISLDHFNSGMAADCTRFTFADRLLKTFITNVTADIADDKRKLAWVGAADRAWRRLKRYEVIPLSRVLARHMKLEWPDHKIRNTAAAIEEDLRPLTLLFAEKPEDFIEMYGSGPTSCMDWRHKETWSMLTQANSHPCAFFAFWPHAKGVYARKQGKVFARTMLYEYAPNDWRYGRIYGNHEQDQDAFVAQLDAAGYKPLDAKHKEPERKYRNGYYRGAPIGMESSTFEMPAYSVEGSTHKVAPLPYFDNLGADHKGKTHSLVSMEYNKDRDVFIVTVGPDVKNNVSMVNQQGVVYSNKLKVCMCRVCGRAIEGDGMMHQKRDAVYCSTRCLKADGAVRAQRDDGNMVIVDLVDAVIDPLNGDVYYTNEQAAIRRNALPLQDSIYVRSEYPEYTRYGGNVQFKNGERIALQGAGYDEAYRHMKGDIVQANVTKLPLDLLKIKEQRNVEFNPDAPVVNVIGDIPEVIIPEEVVTQAKAKVAKAEFFDVGTEFDVGTGISISFGDVVPAAEGVRNVRFG